MLADTIKKFFGVALTALVNATAWVVGRLAELSVMFIVLAVLFLAFLELVSRNSAG